MNVIIAHHHIKESAVRTQHTDGHASAVCYLLISKRLVAPTRGVVCPGPGWGRLYVAVPPTRLVRCTAPRPEALLAARTGGGH